MIGFYFTGAGGKIQLPVNPEELTVKWQGNNQKTEVVAFGEVNILKDSKLAGFSLSLLFPGDSYYPFIVGDWLPPDELVEFFRSHMEAQKTLRFSAAGLGINMRVSVEGVTSTRKAGDHDSISCEVEFSEYRPYSAKILEAPKSQGGPVAASQAKRVADKVTEKTHKVVKGDTLWDIAQKELGNPSRYPEIAKLNNIKNPNLIYPETVLKLPKR